MSFTDLWKNNGQEINALSVNQSRKSDNGNVLGIEDTFIIGFKVPRIHGCREREMTEGTSCHDNGVTVWNDRYAGGRDAGTDHCVLLGCVRNTDDMINIGQNAFERFIQCNTRQIGKAEQGMIRKHTLTQRHSRYHAEGDEMDFESHGLCLEDALTGKWRTGLVSMDDRNPFADQNRP